MDYNFYRNNFQSVISKISKKQLDDLGLIISIDEVMESIALKIYKPEWSSNPQSPLDATGRIFFSIWVNDKGIQEGKLYYNIHAFKLRTFKGYKIASRNFAERFRERFITEMDNWPNVSIQYGPLTLMEGWSELKIDHIEKETAKWVQQFLDISFIIDETLEHYKVQ
ncbi:hypothetical protein [Chryseobacterium paridis]|uniref:Phage protein n=1 Tax=Chryseobacterium paridis TaxID=2800328 RepID=A0ABS1FT24_9FLAO|nr:hypothetical protein [Chryseobacterium paridis]MBK1895583.1 hypothetical protein [Chryseobacterium paridis]